MSTILFSKKLLKILFLNSSVHTWIVFIIIIIYYFYSDLLLFLFWQLNVFVTQKFSTFHSTITYPCKSYQAFRTVRWCCAHISFRRWLGNHSKGKYTEPHTMGGLFSREQDLESTAYQQKEVRGLCMRLSPWNQKQMHRGSKPWSWFRGTAFPQGHPSRCRADELQQLFKQR